MEQSKNLKSIFKSYNPDTELAERIFEESEGAALSGNKDSKWYEVRFSLPFIVSKADLYELENKIRTRYELNCVRLLPKYPSELFELSYMSEVFKEAGRIGAVANGFFDNSTSEITDGTITVSVPFTQGGVDLLGLGQTANIISGIIRDEFDLTYKVVIVQSDDYLEHFDEYTRARDEYLRQFSKEALEAEERASQRIQQEQENKEPAVKLTKIVSLFDASTTADEKEPGVYHTGRMTFDTNGAETALYGELFEISDPTPIRSVNRPMKNVVVLGKIFEASASEMRGSENDRVTIGITDNDSSVFLRLDMEAALSEDFVKSMKSGTCVAACGPVHSDKNEELFVKVKNIVKIKQVIRKDKAEVKRVELHQHTNLSQMDAIATPEEVVKRAHDWGQKAIAITDHGNAQGFPTAMLAAEGLGDVKVIYGIEAYFVDDTQRAVFGGTEAKFNDELVVFDIETTGLSAQTCAITEIGAVIIRDGEVIDEFNMLTDPECVISEEITNLTGITNEMVQGQPKNVEAVKAFLAFAGDRLLIAHNADFDTGFIRKVCGENNIAFENPYLDTVAMSRYVNPDLKKHKLDSLAEYFGLGDFNHHRASDDAKMLAEIYYKMVEKLADEGILSFNQLSDTMSENTDPLKLRPYHQIILAKNQRGLKNLYILISESNLKYYKRVPRIPKTRLKEMREGLIIGSACEAGELFRAILDNAPQQVIEDIANFYDYLEIQPIANNKFLIDEDKVADEEELRNLNRKIVELGEKLGKPVCATTDAHYTDPEDEIYRRIIQVGMKYQDADRPSQLYMRTTEEMLEEFSYLGEEKAYEVVVTNPNMIADMVDTLRPIPEGKFDPHIDGCEEELATKCHKTAEEMYGSPLPEIVSARLERELDAIIHHGFSVMYIIARRLVDKSEEWGYQVGSRGSVGSSFAAMMAGITRVNALPPHYRCTGCKHSEFVTDGSVKSGFDLPPKDCPVCGKKNMYRDGHDIPFETFLGFNGDKVPDIDLNFSGDVQGKIHKYTEDLFGKGHAFRAGTIGTLADKTAYGYVAHYLEGKGVSVSRAEMERLLMGCVGVKKSTGQHPGGIIVVPSEYDVYDFCPVQHPADDPNSDTITTHFEFKYLHDTILKLDELGHDIPTKYKRLEEYTDTSVLDCDLSDKKLYQLFTSTEPLGVKKEDLLGVETGTLGLPEMNTNFVRGVLIQAQPKNFSDLLQISGLTHGTGVWLGNADELIRDKVCTISDVIGCRDDIMLYLLHNHNLEASHAFKIMESVRKGKGLKPEWEQEMTEHNVPEWYLESCRRIKYMFPKAHAAAYVIDALRLGWYKIYYPKEFYAAYFTAAPGGVDAAIVSKGAQSVKMRMDEITNLGKEASAKDKENFSALQLCNEAIARGINFLPVSYEKSDAVKFLPEEKGIRLPFCSMDGLGGKVAETLIAARDNPDITCVEDLKDKAKISKTVIEKLTTAGVLDGLPDSNQLTLF